MAIDFAATDEVVDRSVHVVTVTGEVDLFTAPEFKAHVNAAIDGGRPLVIVDLGDTTFIDSSSLGVLISAQRRLGRSTRRLVVVCATEPVLSTFRITGLDGLLDLVASRDEALALAGA